MKKKIVILSTIVAILIILGGLSPTILSKDLEITSGNENVTMEVNRYYGEESESILTDLSYEEAEELKEILINLNEAIENNDEEAIDQYETILNEKGIFGDKYQEFFSYDTYTEMMKYVKFPGITRYLGSMNNDNISNFMCFFNAVGQGRMLFTLGLRMWEAIVRAVENASSALAGLIILLAMLPFLVLIMLFTHLIPFRILMPIGAITMKNGTYSSLGLLGYKKLEVGVDAVDVVNSLAAAAASSPPAAAARVLWLAGAGDGPAPPAGPGLAAPPGAAHR